jgi:hypothetical protein
MGDAVYYTDAQGVEMPAIVTHVWPGEVVNVRGFPDSDANVRATSVPYDDSGKPGHWRWVDDAQNSDWDTEDDESED